MHWHSYTQAQLTASHDPGFSLGLHRNHVHWEKYTLYAIFTDSLETIQDNVTIIARASTSDNGLLPTWRFKLNIFRLTLYVREVSYSSSVVFPRHRWTKWSSCYLNQPASQSVVTQLQLLYSSLWPHIGLHVASGFSSTEQQAEWWRNRKVIIYRVRQNKTSPKGNCYFPSNRVEF